MKSGMIALAILVMAVWNNAFAFETKDQQIDFILTQMQSGSQQQKEQLLERLQWSGLSDPRLFDVLEADLLNNYQQTSLNSEQESLMAYEVRALGYSGNANYADTLSTLAKKAQSSKIKRHAKKAQRDLGFYTDMQHKLDAVSLSRPDLPFEVQTYMKMLQSNDSFTQRLAARAIYHEQQNNAELIALVAEKLEAVYRDPALDEQGQDMAAWLCKVLKQHSAYASLLDDVADTTPHRKISRYAK